MGPAMEVIEFLARSDHRAGVLDELADGPRERHVLQAATGASPATIGRVLGDFEDRRWVTREGATYRLTPLGEYVADRFGQLQDAMATERKLRDVWRWLPREMDGFSVDLFADAVVSYPGPGYPYEPVERVTELVESTGTMRSFGTTAFKSTNLRAMCDAVLEGMEFECIYTPEVLQQVVAWDPDRVAAAFERENCTVLLLDSLPDDDRCGICVFDDRTGICCHDEKTGVLEAVVDTDSVEAREWATSKYREWRVEAYPLAEADDPLPPEIGR